MRGQKLEILLLERRLASALRKDVDYLAKEFADSHSTQLEQFAELFIRKEFSTIFLGHLSISDFIEFSENLMLHCARYMVSGSGQDSNLTYPNYVIGNVQSKGYEICRLKLMVKRSLSDQIFGIYMCYCLYFLQPAQYVLPIRMSVAQMNNLYKFLNEVVISEEQFEAMFCLYRLIDGGAFAITPFETDFNALVLRRFDNFENDDVSFELNELEASKDFPLLDELSEDLTFKQLSSIHEVYKTMKEQCKLPGIVKSGLASMDLTQYVKDLLKDTRTAFEEQISAAASTSGSSKSAKHDSAQARRSRIKEKAYSTTTTNMHYTSKRSNTKPMDNDSDL